MGESDLDHPVAFDQVKSARFEKLSLIDNAILDKIRKQSETRCTASEDFQEVEKNIAKYLEQKEKKSISLQEEVFMADRKDAEDDLLKEVFEEGDEDQVVDRDFYFNEALAIAIDYAELLKTGQLAKTDPVEPQVDTPKLQAGAQTR